MKAIEPKGRILKTNTETTYLLIFDAPQSKLNGVIHVHYKLTEALNYPKLLLLNELIEEIKDKRLKQSLDDVMEKERFNKEEITKHRLIYHELKKDPINIDDLFSVRVTFIQNIQKDSYIESILEMIGYL